MTSVVSFVERRGFDTSSSIPGDEFESRRSGPAEVLRSVGCVSLKPGVSNKSLQLRLSTLLLLIVENGLKTL